MTRNIVNLQVMAEDAIARDIANGTYDSNLRDDSRHYFWHGTEQVIPMGMDGDPEGFAAALRRAMPLADTLRLPFNVAAFDDQGNLHPLYERFLTAAAAQGFDLLFVQADGAAQTAGTGGGWTVDSLEAHLTDVVVPRMETAFRMLDAWLDRHADVRAATWGFELANEPAAWSRGAELAPFGTKQPVLDRFVTLYAEQMLRLAQATGADADDRILIGGWGFSGQWDELARPVFGGVSALDHLESQLGHQLVWSLHLYPGWHHTTGLAPDAILERLDGVLAPLQGRAALLTEFNLLGSTVNDTTDTGDIAFLFGRMQEWMAERGFGVGWFPGAEAGASALVTIDPGGALRFLHQHSYAFAMNGFTLDDAPEALAGNDRLTATLIQGRLRNEVTDADYDPANPFDPVAGLGLAAGYGGQDTLTGRDDANNLLYGGAGGDRLLGARAEDFLFGQGQDDTLSGGDGADFLYGGTGDDHLFGGAGRDVLEGGRGADHFISTAGDDIIVDFSAADGDRIGFGLRYQTWDQIAARITLVAHDGPDADDVLIRHDDGSTLILNAANTFGPAHARLDRTPGVIEATGSGDTIAPGFTDLDGEVFGTDTHEVVAGAGADLVFGTNRADTLDGGRGDDRLEGGRGRDHLTGGAGDDTLVGGGGSDTLVLDSGQDVARGGGRADLFLVGTGAATLFGDGGNDRFDFAPGGTGHVATGGRGADSYFLVSGNGGTGLTILDFAPSSDRLFLDGNRLDLGALPADVMLTATETGTRLDLSDGGVVLLDGLFL